MSHRSAIFAAIAPALVLLAACQSDIRPLRPIQQVEFWQTPDGVLHPLASTRPAAFPATEPASMTEAATQAATEAATEAATQAATERALASTEPTTQSTSQAATQPLQPPGHLVIRNVDPNQTTRFIYKADYDNIWRQATDLLHAMGFTLDRQDYREGLLITQPLPSAQVVEPWRPQQVNLKDALENTLNSQRRTVHLAIEPVPGKPDFYQISVQVIVDRITNPTEQIGGPVFVQGSGFGGNAVALRSDYVPANAPLSQWVAIGHDPDMEKKILNQLFKHI